jgi:hypothetical protein
MQEYPNGVAAQATAAIPAPAPAPAPAPTASEPVAGKKRAYATSSEESEETGGVFWEAAERRYAIAAAKREEREREEREKERERKRVRIMEEEQGRRQSEDEASRDTGAANIEAGDAPGRLPTPISQDTRRTDSQHSSTDSLFDSNGGSGSCDSEHSEIGYRSDHTCGTSSVFESSCIANTLCLDDEIEAEIRLAYNVDSIPRSVLDLPLPPPVRVSSAGDVDALPEIQVDDFMRYFNTNRAQVQEQMKVWREKEDAEVRAVSARREAHLRYIVEREGKRRWRVAKRERRSLTHEMKRREKKARLVVGEVEWMEGEVRQSGIEAWRRKYCGPEETEGEKEVRRGIDRLAERV